MHMTDYQMRTRLFHNVPPVEQRILAKALLLLHSRRQVAMKKTNQPILDRAFGASFSDWRPFARAGFQTRMYDTFVSWHESNSMPLMIKESIKEARVRRIRRSALNSLLRLKTVPDWLRKAAA